MTLTPIREWSQRKSRGLTNKSKHFPQGFLLWQRKVRKEEECGPLTQPSPRRDAGRGV